MPNITKPNDINNVWASTGDIAAPATSYVANGWDAIIPPREYFNWLDNRQDRFNAHVNQHGIPVWDSTTEYQANLSYSKGSDGNLYRALTTNSNVNPVGDITNAWVLYGPVVATQLEAETGTDNSKMMTPLRVAQSVAKRLVQATTSVLGIARLATTAQVNAGSDNTTIVTPSTLTNGVVSNVSTQGYVTLPTWLGSLTIQWGNAVQTGTGIHINFPKTFTSSAYAVVGQPVPGTNRALAVSLTAVITGNDGFDAYLTQNNAYINGGFYWIAVGR